MSRAPGRRVRQGSRQVWAIVAVGVCLGASAFGMSRYVAAAREAVASAGAATDDEIYTGTILYMPASGNACRQLLFDNQNGQFTDNGYVDCYQATARGADDISRLWSSSRSRVVKSGSRDR